MISNYFDILMLKNKIKKSLKNYFIVFLMKITFKKYNALQY